MRRFAPDDIRRTERVMYIEVLLSWELKLNTFQQIRTGLEIHTQNMHPRSQSQHQEKVTDVLFI